jgi:hypothetical protein
MIVLGGYIDAGGATGSLPSGWASERVSTGLYQVTPPDTTYRIIVIPWGLQSNAEITAMNPVYVGDDIQWGFRLNGSLFNTAFSFLAFSVGF